MRLPCDAAGPAGPAMSDLSLSDFLLPLVSATSKISSEQVRKTSCNNATTQSVRIAFIYLLPHNLGSLDDCAPPEAHSCPLQPWLDGCKSSLHGSLTAPENFCWRVGASPASPPFPSASKQPSLRNAPWSTLTLFKAIPCPCPLASPHSHSINIFPSFDVALAVVQHTFTSKHRLTIITRVISASVDSQTTRLYKKKLASPSQSLNSTKLLHTISVIMFARIASTAAFTGKRAAPAALRHNSTSSTAASRVIQLAAQAERPNTAEAAVPVMYAVGALLTYTAWNRMTERSAGENVEKLLIV